MAKDLLEHQPLLRQPVAAIGWVAGLYLLTTVPLTFMNFDESWRQPLGGLTIWLLAWLVLALPLTGLAAVLAARLERAATGVRHPQRAGWAGVSLGVMLAAHWALHMLWTPAYLLWVVTENHRRDDHLFGAVAASIAWFFGIAGVAIARYTLRRMRARSWEKLKAVPPRILPRLPTPWVGALAYGVAMMPLSILAAVVALDERSPLVAVVMWTVASLVLAGLGGGWSSWVYAGLGREPRAPRFAEVAGCAWIGLWLPFWLLAAAPFWGDRYHEEQLVASILSAAWLVVGVAMWSYGKAARPLSVA